MPIGSSLPLPSPLNEPQAQNEKARKNVINFQLSEPKYTFDDLILPPSTLSQVNKALAFRKHHDLVFKQWGLQETHRHSKRVCLNFYGAPGTGKTMTAHAVAHYLEKPLLIINYADIESKYVGDTPKNLIAAFEMAQKHDAVLFFDEADAMLSKRVTNMSNSTDTSVNQTHSVLLNILNDYDKTILFATNFIENFDSAFMRRILAHVNFLLPDSECRKKLFDKYLPKEMPHQLDTKRLSEQCENLSGSDISNAILLGAFSAAERDSKCVDMEDIQYALKSIQDSKQANAQKISIKTREVTQAEVEQSLGEKL
ncbi:MAG: ATP-binding protein [Thiolinea sp.]